MASGTIKGSFTGTSTANVYPEIRWRSTKNDANNNSSVKAELWFVKVNSYWYPYNLSGYSCAININGNSATATRTIDMRSAWSQKIWERTVTVAHNADGNKSITISSSGGTGLNLGSVSVSGKAKLDTIPRASNIGTISGNQIGSAITIPISRASGSFTHDVTLKLGSATVSATGVGTSAKLTPPLDAFCRQLTTATSGTAVVTVVTKSGSTTIGTKTKNHTIYVPSSVVPNAKTLNIAERVSAVASLGLTKTFVQNKSTIGLTASADGIYGSTIKDYTFTFNGRSQGGTVGRDFAVGTASAGNHTVTVTVTDSRGRKASRSDTVSVLAYSVPNITKFDVARDGTTLKVKTNITASVHNIASKGGSWKVQRASGNSWVNVDSGAITTSYTITGKTLTGDYDVTKSFNFRLVVSDAFGEGAILIRSVSTSQTLLDLNKNDGVGIGKMHERGALDVGGNTYISGRLNVYEGTLFQGYNILRSAGPNSNNNSIMVDMRRANDKQSIVFSSNSDKGYVAMNLYDENGTYKRVHYFKHDGRVELNSDLSVGGEITSNGRNIHGGNIYSNGKRVHTDWTPPELYSGAIFMGENQKVYPTKKLSQCRNGWALYWSDYTWETSTTNNWDWNITYVHKSALTASGFNGFHSVVGQANSKPAIVKYMYLRDDHLLGNIHNTSTSDLKNVVLRKVYEF